MAEFFRQGDEERQRGLAISAFMDRREAQVAKCQAGFLDFIVLPMYTALVGAFPDARPLVEGARANRDHWAAAAPPASAPAPAAPASPSSPAPASRSNSGNGVGVAVAARPASAAAPPAPPASEQPAGHGQGTNRSHGAASNGASHARGAGTNSDQSLGQVSAMTPKGALDSIKSMDRLQPTRSSAGGGLEALSGQSGGAGGAAAVHVPLPPGMVLSRRGSRSHSDTPPPLAPFAMAGGPGPASGPDLLPSSPNSRGVAAVLSSAPVAPAPSPSPERRGSLSGLSGTAAGFTPPPRPMASGSSGSLDTAGREGAAGAAAAVARGRRPSITVLGADGQSTPLA
eukprot:tig00000402_g181.t1